ncbi:MAG: hypothetical protein CM1200mP34_0480 [Verrucomicrobiales bacterium]|nr:MAG: hypothetical protein CM1200mP34_0480 [Verrucomicrobiales bacterium]
MRDGHQQPATVVPSAAATPGHHLQAGVSSIATLVKVLITPRPCPAAR